ncbi:hypothetical protein BP6252_13506 [Coleophoma cylindrospora]|uniref:Origin recognition complex subunit 4 n=1 Tax=Coleophoma cylindrospora TaxID=1849047 RepID=A0A3D8Q8D1_9HELO|nr:hypothetical protein BP6252_13506 [Coleophoma cylindrospora]
MSSSNRKRSRPQLQDVDELSPPPVENTPSSVKRRKFETQDSSPSIPTVAGFFKKTAAYFGLDGATQQARDNAEAEAFDELGATDEDIEILESQEEDATGNQRGRASSVRAATKKNPEEVAESDHEVVQAPAKKRGRPPKNKQGSTDSPANLASSAAEKEPPKKRGRPSKRAMLNKAKILAKQAARERIEAEAHESEEPGADNGATLTKDKVSTDNVEIVEAQAVEGIEKAAVLDRGNETQPAIAETNGSNIPIKRKRGRPRKNPIVEPDKSTANLDLGFKDAPKNGSGRHNKKGVEHAPAVHGKSIYDFEISDDERGPGNKVAKRPNAKSTTKETTPESDLEIEGAPTELAGGGDSDEEDDEVCEVCGKAESKAPNLIVFCESCPRAVHQKCYDIPVIPRGDWFCRACQAGLTVADPSGQEALTNGGTTTDLVNRLPDIDGCENHLRATQRIVLDKLTGKKNIMLRGFNDEMQKVFQLVEQTVQAGEGNSMLIIGARGSGKTTLVESVISDLSDQRENFHVIRLNGFIHTDDKLALREIWQQLGREMEVDDESDKPNNHADTLASLLALLSHPSEISEDQVGETAKSVIFILDEFDLFTTHPRQTLLYNLFDIAQARKAPIAVLGLTTRIDVVESLEKRVKSRFSHRYVHLSLPKSLPAFWDICKEGLLVSQDDVTEEIAVEGLDEFLSYWQGMIEELFQDRIFKDQLQTHFYRTKSVPELFTSCILPIANLSPSRFPLTGRAFESLVLSLSAPDSKLHMLQGLSEVELALLIAAARLDIILDTDTCNFAMAYDEYTSLTSRHKIQTSSTGIAALGASAKVWGREVALGAWERLAEYELLIPATMGAASGRDIGIGGRMWKVDVGLEEISGSLEGLTGIMAKWCREI